MNRLKIEPHFRRSGVIAKAILEALWESKRAEPFEGCTAEMLIDIQVSSFAHELQALVQQLSPAAEPFGTYVERDDGTSEFRRFGVPFSRSTQGYRAWTVYAAPMDVAAAPAAAKPIATLHSDGHWTGLDGWQLPLDKFSIDVYGTPPATRHQIIADFLISTGQYVTNDATREAAMKDAVDKATSQISSDHDQTIGERDHAEKQADALAKAIGKYFDEDVGEHSSAHCPWVEALALIEGMQAEKDAAAGSAA